jgi:iron complex outermembrane recepter protein
MSIKSRAFRPAYAVAFATPFAFIQLSDAKAQTVPVSLPEIEIQGTPVEQQTIQDAPASGITTPRTLTATPTGQVQTTIGQDRTTDTRAFSVSDLLIDSPGVTIKQGNGPRDFGISIRGSNARNGFGIRNIVMFDDGFPVTQPDGLSRSDLIDPHAYGSVDVVRGPSSALYGNYATGGAIDFRTTPGHVIDGLEVGTDGGSYGYLNSYLIYGKKIGDVEASVFVSEVQGSSKTIHSNYDTQTVNALLTYTLTPEDRLTFKFIENHLDANLSNRLSLNQFLLNPYQRGCASSSSPVPGCRTVGLFANGFNAPTVPTSANQAGFGRNDNRAIFGLRYEHDFGTSATWRTQVTIDDRNINQPTGMTTAIGDYPSINAISDVVGHSQFFGLDATHYAAIFVNTLSNTAYTYYVTPFGDATLGGLSQVVPSTQTNFGGRVREELRFNDKLTLVGGVGVERSNLTGQSLSFTYSAPNVVSSTSNVNANRSYLNTAPEVSLVYKPFDKWQVTGRVATGYGTPNASNLFITSSGQAGNNTDLKSQTNLGYDLAVSYQALPKLALTVDGFYEFFRNELVTQSAGPGLMNFTFNAPRSEHRGAELAAKWEILPSWLLTAAYTYDNQIYTQYNEQLSAGAFTQTFNRAGNRIPGVPLNELLLRLGYDVPEGPVRGLGAYVEYVKQSDFYIDNANLVKAPGYGVVNLNLHYNHEINDSFVKAISAYFEIRNVTNQTYVASANNVSDTLNAATGRQNGATTVAATAGSIYAGIPISFFGGVRVKF